MKTALTWAVAILAASMSVGCETPQTEKLPRMAFPVEEYEKLPTQGTGIVRGQAFLRTVGGDVKVGAGSKVALNPVTSIACNGTTPIKPIKTWQRTPTPAWRSIYDGPRRTPRAALSSPRSRPAIIS
jgi:hypothetical protein